MLLLQVLENGEGGTEGTLLAALNNCVTPVGRRRLRQWLCRPLARIPDIVARQVGWAGFEGRAAGRRVHAHRSRQQSGLGAAAAQCHRDASACRHQPCRPCTNPTTRPACLLLRTRWPT